MDPTPNFPRIRVKFDPYNHDEVQMLLRQITAEFGQANRGRWYYKSPEPSDLIDNNVWELEFIFHNPHDATIFGLKYLE